MYILEGTQYKELKPVFFGTHKRRTHATNLTLWKPRDLELSSQRVVLALGFAGFGSAWRVGGAAVAAGVEGIR